MGYARLCIGTVGNVCKVETKRGKRKNSVINTVIKSRVFILTRASGASIKFTGDVKIPQIHAL